ncbi:hypothetical protein [Hymenobacter cellulosilyticus]|uniref:Transmembrane protein n=1 Tax=Hymenobacter cellulosilyticus TaxID=2932248 RepID=A0A8T9Q2S4_9BACT|nr:hypothetical protein [Hymenobacter cellulosilyticus]UOQ70761.1 hypothetical protein MUN79_18970 [Hymenobacter cellulosilyticus]
MMEQQAAKGWLKNFNEKLVLITSVVSTLATIVTQVVKTYKTGFNDVGILIAIDIVNLLILVYFYLKIQPEKFICRSELEREKLAEILHISKSKVDFNIERVNTLVSQICFSIGFFIIFLSFFYLIQIIKDYKDLWANVESVLSNADSIEDLFDSSSRGAIYFIVIEFFENFFNMISAAFVYICFKVLYDTTLDEENHPVISYHGTVLLLSFYFIAYIWVIFNGIPGLNLKYSSHIFRLLCGVYNGFAMSLLFGRLTSMEYFFKSDKPLIKQSFIKRFYYYGVVFVLPLYILAQPMYGVFYATEFGSNVVFKSLVFTICFIGKAFFLVLLLTYIRNRWLHAYLHNVLANQSLPRGISNDFDEIVDLD